MVYLMSKGYQNGHLLSRDSCHKILETCKALKAYAESIEKNHSAACSHGAGYSLLGQLAQQVSTDLYYALKAFEGSGE